MKAVIVVWTKTGHTLEAAHDIMAGLKAAGVSVDLVDLRVAAAPDLAPYDIVVVGSPCHAGSMKFAGSGIAKPVEAFLRTLKPGTLTGKRAAAYSVQCSMGGRRTAGSVEGILADAGAEVVAPGPVVTAGAFLSAWVGPQASPADRAVLEEFGRQVGAG